MSSWRNSSPLHQQQLQQQQQQQQQQQPQPYSIHNGNNINNNNNNNNNNTLENGPRAKCDQVVFEAIAKAAEIVVGSRCWIDHIPPAAAGIMGGGAGASSSSSSSRRFNLLVPEVQGVRTILQRWKRALHVPLRLDVYYQHADSRRELLERWCLEYAPKTSTHHPTATSSGGFTTQQLQQHQSSTDPIVQLRQVCKQIVIWLRSLYCWARMLPSQALRSQNTQNNAIGFSIYVVSEGNDDVSGLVSQQGFLSQGQPHSVWTPYGELGWKVFYAPKSVVQRLIPQTPPYSHQQQQQQQSSYNNDYNNNNMIPNQNHNHYPNGSSLNARTASQPIPMRPQQQQQQQQQQVLQQQTTAQSFHPQQRDLLTRRDSTPAATTTASTTNTARSAPQHSGRLMYQRSKSDVSDAHHQHHHHHAMSVYGDGNNTQQLQLQQPMSSSPHHRLQQQSYQQYPNNSPGALGRLTTRNAGSSSPITNPPSKNLSGLSLAMMTLSDNDDVMDNANNSNNPHNDSSTTMNSEAAEKRRAALHHAPPQLLLPPHQLSPRSLSHPNKQSPLASAGEYGYAYNNHIPTIRSNHNLNNNNSNTPPNGHNPLLPAPSTSVQTPLGSTPPGYLLGGPTPPPAANWSNLIPPRGAVTPPFTRPMGFVGEPPPSQLLPPPAAAAAAANNNNATASGSTNTTMNPHANAAGGGAAAAAAPPPTTSLDLLHSSPFRQPIYGSHYFSDPFSSIMGSGAADGGGMLFSSSPGAAYGGSGSFGTNKMRMIHPTTSTSGLYPRLQAAEEGYGDDGDDDDDNSMPFAVDDATDGDHENNHHPFAAALSASASGHHHHTTTATSSSGGGSTLILREMIQPPKRLQLFESLANNNNNHANGVGSSSTTTSAGTASHNMGMMGGGRGETDDFADQLAEFKSFGASLTLLGASSTVPPPGGGSGEVEAT